MTEADKVFAGNIPALYQQHMVPMLFEPYAQEMAGRVARLKPQTLLEIAAGTGVLTRALAARLGDTAEIIATDLNQPMLDLAAHLQRGGGKTTFRQADAQALPFDDGSFDVAVCQFGVMFFPDKLQGYREVRRVLKPGGSYLFSVWDRVSANAFVTTVSDALAKRFPADPPRFMERTPHGYFDTDAIIDTLHEAGFSEVKVETADKISRAESAASAAAGYCQGSPLSGEIEARQPGKLWAVTKAVASALAERFGPGEIEGEVRAHVITART
ncbi:class I SAM-dependent methyltransferase [Aliirhizobium cellulosilyticum]|uniref:Ubiquinone/menaquinone biosynthesis C-methylase UbiE n=1 Tax=Aliirhizobium cellulosilyticum TaxID=393664 RepID=A0A7W6TLJ1_9HYPH|nr:class I SAM-dependent methyltransferase [Rhizobium cellulosilyticum]MBB4351808.1 ubiquinone/menaquinone biosynthesis C-methylase UbiE [Rhizobium cellulosilyticum]MBB4415043.1 ubiquinone/menaquinone biosynthesis C-methylase UbiE [Rhizobium cellulosilyticum]MBB4449735.1 ubiquinone/menaquinone biosynthesis C-methylase UbiE [Rhizobium cellulosilyticum]